MSATMTAGPALKVVQPGKGQRGTLIPGVGVIFKLEGRDTGGALSIVEHTFEVGALVPPHLHDLEDEYSIVLEGEIGFRSEDAETVLGAGGYIIKPRAQVHAMWNAGRTPARMIEVISPPGFEDFFHALVDMTNAGEPDPAEIVRTAARYEHTFHDPAWLPDIIERYGLTPAPRLKS